jgi:large subunit ribosomal protein L24
MSISPQSPRRQRKAVYEADIFERRLRMTVPLSRELRARFHRRSVPLRKGDTVRVMKGSFVGREERVQKVDRRSYTVTLDNVTLKSGEEKLKPLPIRTAHLLLVRLNLADEWRREALKVRPEELTPEERGETPEPEETAEPAPSPAPAKSDETEEPDAKTDDDEPSESAPAAAPTKGSRRSKSPPSPKSEEEA